MLPTPNSGMATLAPPRGCPSSDVTRPDTTALLWAAATLVTNTSPHTAASTDPTLRNELVPPMSNLAEREWWGCRAMRTKKQQQRRVPVVRPTLRLLGGGESCREQPDSLGDETPAVKPSAARLL